MRWLWPDEIGQVRGGQAGRHLVSRGLAQVGNHPWQQGGSERAAIVGTGKFHGLGGVVVLSHMVDSRRRIHIIDPANLATRFADIPSFQLVKTVGRLAVVHCVSGERGRFGGSVPVTLIN